MLEGLCSLVDVDGIHDFTDAFHGGDLGISTNTKEFRGVAGN
eukprot:CAMPEP_0184702052 /NCGR_PEP_ID=MMETSP0313-20130426/22520_1 /TAXON_ID=2792 /ORGANISM="Porphyridium aerugineum, Strain SAG 1380-2" /LENGTH=41 /DNA_ID= /DNA_START= /DNA_END= /DNA_ORIENTATION=